MKDIRDLTNKERIEIFKLLKPIGYKEGDDLHTCEIIIDENGEQTIKEIPDASK